jgi:hypothetical protein
MVRHEHVQFGTSDVGHVLILHNWHVTVDTVVRQTLPKFRCHAAVVALVTTEAALREHRDVTSLIRMWIVTCCACHLRLLKTAAHLQSCQLVTRMDATDIV